MESNKISYIWLNSLGLTSRTISNIEKEIKDIKKIWCMSNKEINTLKSIKPTTKEKICKGRSKNYLEKIKKTLYNSTFNVITILDDEYPEILKTIYDPPKVLYINGEIKSEDSLAIAVVGSRKMTSYGEWVTNRLVKDLVDLGITIVSGLALGVDTIAHKAALSNHGRTIAVLANGVDIVYPKRNKSIYEQIRASGAVISEYFFGTQPLPYNFPNRNRIISGLARGILIVEAKERSGSLITGYLGLEQGKEVFAIPGNINSVFSKGTNKLIQDGAKLVTSVDDIIEEIYAFQHLQKKAFKTSKSSHDSYSDTERKILNIIRNQPATSDEISEKTGLDIRIVSSILTILEMKGVIEEISGSLFVLL